MVARRILICLALAGLIVASYPRYRYGVGCSDYSRAAQMVVLVWAGFYLSSRYWAKSDPPFAGGLMVAAAIVCIPPLIINLGWSLVQRFHHFLGNVVVLLGIAFYTYGRFARARGS